MTQPDTCHVCGRQAIGIATGKDRWLCAECVPLLEYVKDIRRPSPYELKAREGGMEAAGEIIEQFGTDLAAYTEEQALMLVGACWRGTADRIRWLIKNQDAPF